MKKSNLSFCANEIKCFVNTIRDLYPDYKTIFVFGTEKRFIDMLDGKVYAIMDTNGKFICDVLEEDWIVLSDKGYINHDNYLVVNDYKNDVLQQKIKIIILEELLKNK